MRQSTLIVGDLHLIDKVPGYLDFQVKWLKDLVAKYKEVIFLGDIFDKRKPTPTELLAFKKLIDESWHTTNWYVIKGNHDSETKSKDSVTSLSLFETEFVDIINKPKTIEARYYAKYHNIKWKFIPHYEDENIIKEELKNVGRDDIVFGHFGYTGCINSTGSYDFNIEPSLFTNCTYLGHIHTYSKNSNITIVGTPYTTSFGEAGKKNYVVELYDDGTDKVIETVGGIRHLVYNLEDFNNADKDYINDDRYFTLLRLFITNLKGVDLDNLRTEIISKYNVKYLDFRFIPKFEIKQKTNYTPLNEISLINEGIIHKYIDGSNTKIPKDRLLKGLDDIKNLN